jgi:hypothetical protein
VAVVVLDVSSEALLDEPSLLDESVLSLLVLLLEVEVLELSLDAFEDETLLEVSVEAAWATVGATHGTVNNIKVAAVNSCLFLFLN